MSRFVCLSAFWCLFDGRIRYAHRIVDGVPWSAREAPSLKVHSLLCCMEFFILFQMLLSILVLSERCIAH